MLGGNSEFLAKEEMKKKGYTDILVEESTTYSETDNEQILEARKTFVELEKKYDEKIKEEKIKVIAAGGLKIIGTERHESRRIDNQLRGRSGRQGDPGESRFYIGLDDDLMKIFGGDMVTNVYNRLGADEDLPLQMGILSRAVENAQKRVESKHFSIRKHVLQYDDVMNAQREIIYKQRRQVLDGENLRDNIFNMIGTVAEELVTTYIGEDENKEGLLLDTQNVFDINELDEINKTELNQAEIMDELKEKAFEKYAGKEAEIGEEIRELERVVVLKVVDEKWMDHIDAMDELKNGIGLRAYGQKDPVVQYRIEGFEMFDEMRSAIISDVVKILLHVNRVGKVQRKTSSRITGEKHEEILNKGFDMDKVRETPKGLTPLEPIKNEGPKVGRNDPCPCGSGKKYKQCCGK